MNQSWSARLDELWAYVEGLGAADYQRHKAKTQDQPDAIFDLIKRGDAVGVAVALKEGISREITNEYDMTPLHMASACDTRLIAGLLMTEPNGAPWMRDAHGRLPLDVAREAGHDALGNQLQEVTYPELFRDLEGTAVPADLLMKYTLKCLDHGRPDTASKGHQVDQASKDHDNHDR